MGEVFKKGPIELRLGDYRDVLTDVEPDAVITDPPYSERTLGAELDPKTYALACARIELTALTAPLPGIAAPRRMEQAGLALDGEAAE